MISKIAHVCLNVSDFERTVAFYHGALGMPVRFRFEKQGKPIGAYFEAGAGTYVEFFVKKDLKVSNTGIVHLCLEVADIDQAMADLAAKGVACTPKKLGADQTWQTWIADPDGNRIELHQYTPDSAQARGGVVEVNW